MDESKADQRSRVDEEALSENKWGQKRHFRFVDPTKNQNQLPFYGKSYVTPKAFLHLLICPPNAPSLSLNFLLSLRFLFLAFSRENGGR